MNHLNNGGFIWRTGGYIYYAHPQWNSSWGGNLKFKDCDIDSLEPAPNRFVWEIQSVQRIEDLSNAQS